MELEGKQSFNLNINHSRSNAACWFSYFARKFLVSFAAKGISESVRIWGKTLNSAPMMPRHTHNNSTLRFCARCKNWKCSGNSIQSVHILARKNSLLHHKYSQNIIKPSSKVDFWVALRLRHTTSLVLVRGVWRRDEFQARVHSQLTY